MWAISFSPPCTVASWDCWKPLFLCKCRKKKCDNLTYWQFHYMYRHIHLCSNAEAVLTTIIITTISYSRRAFSAEQGPTRVQFYFVAAIYTSHVLKESKISHCVPLAHLAHMFQQAHFISFLKVLRFVDYISRKGRCIGCMSHKNSFWMLEPRHFFLVARGTVIWMLCVPPVLNAES